MDFGVVVLDHIFNDYWRLDATYRYATQSVLDTGQVDIAGIIQGNISGTPTPLVAVPVPPRFTSVRLTGQLTPTLINEFVFGYARNCWLTRALHKPRR
jgi:hypothetical protein